MHRADNVGSLLRPLELLQARQDFDAGEIGVADLPAKYRDPANQRQDIDGIAAAGDAAPMTLTGVSLKLRLQEIEIGLIKKALAEADGVVAAAARLLKMRRTTLVEKLAKYDINH